MLVVGEESRGMALAWEQAERAMTMGVGGSERSGWESLGRKKEKGFADL
jgi:hypothetical protein